ncbi:fungal-specific transcription factor domain-containing protein [Mycena capillaripes]|nr:fungal-specific transcription factor domain-containing protein [Mycena capillaripes]
MDQVNFEDPSPSTVQITKKRRLQGSCDVCRKKKSTSIYFGVKSGGSSSAPSLKTGQEHVAAILSTSIVYVPPHDYAVAHQILLEVAQYARSLEEKLEAPLPITAYPKPGSPIPSPIEDFISPRTPEAGDATGDPDSSGRTNNEPGTSWNHSNDTLESLVVPTPAPNKSEQFYGKSSSIQFIKSAIKHIHGNTSHVVGFQRPEFWCTPPWEILTIHPPNQIFPENDLLQSLMKIYFEQINPILGILHFPSFHQSILDDLHLRDSEFGAVVLAVCSLASRHSEDPRVLLDGTSSEHSCGWKWFRQVRPLHTSFSPEASLYQLQLICLSAIYLSGTSAPEECWILAGIGIGIAQGAGAHHRSGYSKMKPLTAELYKRVFWVLVVSDTIMSSFQGRPSMTQPADFDLDLPIACDEEYWEIPNSVQPSGIPSRWAAMPAYFQLMQIYGRIQGAVYPVNGQMCSEDVIVELDSALNKWVDIVPEHLRWDPNQQNQTFLDLSAVLYVEISHFAIYLSQVLIHRPFISAPGKESMLKTHFPSLAICANAARSCGHVLDVQARRGRGLLHYPSLMTSLFDCAVVLLINVWEIVGGRHSRPPEDFTRATVDAQNCVRVLRLYERRWRVAGRKCDIISAMLNLGKHASAAHSVKRSRDAEEVQADNVQQVSLHRSESPAAGFSTAAAQQIEALERSIQETAHLFSLPLHTEELGRLPVYDSFDYEFTFKSGDIEYPPLDFQYDVSAPIGPQVFPSVDPALGDTSLSPAASEYALIGGSDSIFSSPQVEMAGGEDIQLPPVSFDIPSGYGWREWSTYLANVDGLNQGDF